MECTAACGPKLANRIAIAVWFSGRIDGGCRACESPALCRPELALMSALGGRPDLGMGGVRLLLMTHCRPRRSSLLALRYSYSINSSALSRIDVGTSRPSALAVVI